MKKITNIIYLAILGILSFFPVSVVFLSFSNLIKIIDELEGDSPSAQSASFSSEISLDFLYKLKFFVFIAPILSILMGIHRLYCKNKKVPYHNLGCMDYLLNHPIFEHVDSSRFLDFLSIQRNKRNL